MSDLKRLASLAGRQEEIASLLAEQLLADYPAAALETLLGELVTADPGLARLAPALLQSRAALRERVLVITRHYVLEFGLHFRPALYRAATVLVARVLGAAFGNGLDLLSKRTFEDRVRADGSLDQLGDLRSRATLVFVSTHSSNLDALVLGLVLARRGFPPCVYPAGKHLYRNALAGALVQRLGAYQIDRGLQATLYKQILIRYSAWLLQEGFHCILFPTGTRSRTNLVDQDLKLGLLGSILRGHRARASASAASGPIVVVPLTINYQVVPEASILVRYFLQGRGQERVIGDELGKQGGMVSLLRRVTGLEQRVHLRFGEPLDVLGNPLPDRKDALASGPADPDADAERTRGLGAAIAAAFLRDTRFHCTHVVARASHDLLSESEGAMELQAMLLRGAGGLAVDRHELLRAIERTREFLDREAPGCLLPEVTRETAANLLGQAESLWARCHAGGVLSTGGPSVTITSLPLLYFYSNRSAHLSGH